MGIKILRNGRENMSKADLEDGLHKIKIYLHDEGFFSFYELINCLTSVIK